MLRLSQAGSVQKLLSVAVVRLLDHTTKCSWSSDAMVLAVSGVASSTVLMDHPKAKDRLRDSMIAAGTLV